MQIVLFDYHSIIQSIQGVKMTISSQKLTQSLKLEGFFWFLPFHYFRFYDVSLLQSYFDTRVLASNSFRRI